MAFIVEFIYFDNLLLSHTAILKKCLSTYHHLLSRLIFDFKIVISFEISARGLPAFSMKAAARISRLQYRPPFKRELMMPLLADSVTRILIYYLS